MNKLPITVLVITKNEEQKLARCLESVSDFSEVIVIDSQSTDLTKKIAKKYNAKVVDFVWNNSYPKKRQWCIDTQNIGHDWILWLDADEVVTAEFIGEISVMSNNSLPFCGYFVKGQYVWNKTVLKHGLQNNKLVVYNKSMIAFPVVDDLDVGGMGEIEGHFQPIRKEGYEDKRIGQINSPILHYAYEDEMAWKTRHEGYAHWEACMILRDAYPKDPVFWREALKKITRKSGLKPMLIFIYSYIVKLGFLDGKAGLAFALSRKTYCDMVLKELRLLKGRAC
ncbi:MAG: glycosyltransferase family 2 protein [Alphaproteobacteria bacterium]|nr:glycosyltransferase family 2 protein [Alphaproteobacteria bacterium]